MTKNCRSMYLSLIYYEKNQNFSIILLENIDNEIPAAFYLVTPSKEAAETNACGNNTLKISN